MPRFLRTARADDTIFHPLSEHEFRTHLVRLQERCNAVPMPPTVHVPPISTQHAHQRALRDRISMKEEQQLADDIAWIVAVEEGAQNVVAACIEYNAHRVDVKVAGAQNTTVDVKAQVAHILGHLAQHNTNAETRVNAIFHEIIALHDNRIIAYMRSSKWKKPKHLAKSHKNPMWMDFASLAHRVQFVYSKKEKLIRAKVEQRISELGSIYRAFDFTESDSLDEHAESGQLEEIVRTSYDLCINEDIVDFISRLILTIGERPTAQVSAAMNLYRQIENIAAYYRIARSFIDLSTKYQDLFCSPLQIEYLRGYESLQTEIGYEAWATTCHVHAEMQLMVYYDLLDDTQVVRPRCIGTSKWLCYLCYLFLLAHGGYYVSRTHGRLYDQWTLPDLAEYPSELVNKYRNMIRMVDEQVVALTESAIYRPEPMTCRQDFALL